MKNLRHPVVRAAVVAGVVWFTAAGCNKKVDHTIAYTNAINTYYAARPACLWPQPVKFPVQEETSDTSKTMPYDALVDQGLLVRTTAEKKKFIVTSKQVNNYDLSDSGRSAWTADTSQPGFGNFCYGHRTVSSIDSSTPAQDQQGATSVVAYHVKLSGVPGWANEAETQNAYPQVKADLAGPQSAQATLTYNGQAWQVTTGPADNTGFGSSNPATPADGKIVQ